MNNLRKLRKSKNLTLEELAKITNINKTSIARYETGEVEMKADTLQIFASFFEVSTDYLLNNTNKITFKEKVTALMNENNITQTELAIELGVTQSLLSRNINGMHKPKAEIAKKIADFFGISIDYLLNEVTVKNRLRELRETHGLTLRQVAQDLNMSFSNLGALERGEHQIREDVARKFANYYNVSFDYLLGESYNEEAKLLIGDKIKKLREDAHISQVELSQKINVGNKTLSDYERNISQPSLQTLLDIANFFNVSVDYLLGRDTEMKSGKDELIKELNDNVELLSSEQLKEILDFTLFIIKKDQK